MGRSLHLAAAAGAALLLTAAAPALADPAGRTTLTETIRPASGPPGAVGALQTAPGERYVVRQALARAKPKRARTRRSLAFFAQITDAHVVDEMSPARVELLDPAGGQLSAAWRPQEALQPFVLDQLVRNIDANRTSALTEGKGKRKRRATLQFAIETGDTADNVQRNETRWAVSILDGGPVDPFSGRAIDASNPCPGATPEEIAKLNDDVANRRYTGVQDQADFPAAPPDRYAGFWDPDRPAATRGPYAAFPRYPGLMDRAQRPFVAAGLQVPWYAVRGNHDGLVQGNAPASDPIFRAIVRGCLKVFPSGALDPASFAGQSSGQLFHRFGDPDFVAALLAGALHVPPDPDRAFVSKREYKALQGRADRRHGFGYVSRGQERASERTASYYAFTRHGIRFVALDTVAEGGGEDGNLDDPQYRWLRQELQRATDRDQLVVVYGHHTLETMDNRTPDEEAGCTNPRGAGCDGDPRRSTPIHLGTSGPQSVRDLLLRYRRVIAYVDGHTHHDAVRAFRATGGRSGFWEINSAAGIDFPQQAREIEILDNRDGTLSIFGTLLDQAAPVAAPPPGPATDFTDAQLASLARQLAFDDPQRSAVTGGGGPGRRADRNVELLLRDPRR